MIFDKIRSVFEKPAPVDLSILKVDFHSHLVPGIDDGAKDMSDALQLISGLQRLGYKKVITTPHIMGDMYRNNSQTILAGLEAVKTELYKNKIDIQMEAAAEYYIDEYFERLVDDDELLTFGNGYLLFELSFLNKPTNLELIINKLKKKGIKPILAHPERYPYMFDKSLSKYHQIKEMGVYFQLNLLSALGGYNPNVLRAARHLIDADMIDFIGSDLHNKSQLDFLQDNLRDKYLSKVLSSEKILNRMLF